IDTSGLAALLVSVGACVGLALNGALSNLAGGILIILTRPFSHGRAGRSRPGVLCKPLYGKQCRGPGGGLPGQPCQGHEGVP
ncbi:MAG: mechanosensitive ion channel, partial [Bacteroidaceae bacterium]|nr:mechanosensitive ion channel [Bacteroidaceae bacterium]